MKEDRKVTLADSIPNEDCYTIDDVASEFGLSTLRMRQVLDKAFKEQIVPKLIKKDGRRVLYAPDLVKNLLAARERGVLGKFNKRSPEVSLKHAKMIIQVPIFDEDIVKLLKSKFQDETQIAKFLQTKVEETVKPFLAKKKQLELEFEQKMEKLMREPELSM